MDAFASSTHIGMIFYPLALRRRSDRRGEVRSLRDEHLLPHVSQRSELRRSGQVGLDGLRLAVLLLAVVLLAGCDSSGDRPRAAALRRSGAGVQGRVREACSRSAACSTARPSAAASRAADPAGAGSGTDAVVVERIGVFGESLTFADAGHKTAVFMRRRHRSGGRAHAPVVRQLGWPPPRREAARPAPRRPLP